LTRDSRPSLDLPALTALRAIAALLVFLYHFAPRGLPYLAGIVIGQGHVGVTVFFVLSGFLITVRYYPQFASGQGNLGAYFVKRAARILPLYYAVLVLTHLAFSGAVPLDAAHLPEWTLTHGLFGPSLEGMTVLTSWSLTVEECFYASAPLLFLAVAALRRRLGGLWGSLAALGAAALAVHLAGLLLLQAQVAPERLPLLSQPGLLLGFTIFGRFPDFALGVAAGLLFLSGRVEEAWRRRRGAFLSTLVAVGGTALLVAAQVGLASAGDNPAVEWRWNVLVAAASTALVLALTCREAPLSRLLALRPAVYLGRISYALYLIQLTPLGANLLYRILPGRDGVPLLSLYLGMSVVAALLFELVEEPARRTVLALWRQRSLPTAQSSLGRGLSAAILLAALAAQHTLWAVCALPAADEAAVVEQLGPGSQHLVRAAVPEPAAEGTEPRVQLPASWWRGPRGDRLSPRSLLVFVDGKQVPFLGVRPEAGAEPYAYYRRPRTDYLSLEIDPPAMVTVVNHAPLVALALTWSRVAKAPLLPVVPLVLLAGAAFAAFRNRRAGFWKPQFSLAVAAALLVAWIFCGLHLYWWAPLALGLELAALGWLALSARRGCA
jgi:peptidoglycan/LPS O-acetylase OafA/YrhL